MFKYDLFVFQFMIQLLNYEMSKYDLFVFQFMIQLLNYEMFKDDLFVFQFMIQLLRFLGSRMHDTIWCLPTAMEIDVDVTEQIILNVDTLINWLIKIMMLKVGTARNSFISD